MVRLLGLIKEIYYEEAATSTSSETQQQMKSITLLNIVVIDGISILKLFVTI
jgi:hypothetical protein